MKPRSKRNKKRPRSELYDSIIENQDHEITFRRLELLDGITAVASTTTSTTTGIIGWLRTVEPYPYTFSSFAKARWIGRTVLDVYSTEFGSYPKSYYESAITQGRILVSDKKVDSNYLIKGSDVLTHTVHRHEPGVAVYSNESPFVKIVNDDNEEEDDDEVLVVDKPGTLPIHPCGGYHIQSLMNILEPIYGKLYTIHRLDRLTSGLVILGKTSSVAQEWGKAVMNRNCQKFYLARVKGKFPLNVNTIDDNNNNNQNLLPHLMGNETTTTTKYPLNGEWAEATTTTSTADPSSSITKVKKDVSMERRRNAYGYWITDGNETSVMKQNNETELQLLQHVFDSQFDEDDWLRQQEEDQVTEEGSDNGQVVDNSNETKKKKTESLLKNPRNNMLWFHMACPTRVAKHKDGICEAGSFDTLDDELYLKGVKPAQTSFGVVRYDKHTDSTLVVCKPETGRTHQIRLHLQHLGHPIANDPNYGGEMWYGNPTGKHLCQIAKSKLDKINEDNRVEIDRTTNGGICSSGDVEILPPALNGSASATNTTSSARRISDQPATEQEVVSAGITDATRQETESIHDFIRRTCVWCARAGKQQQQQQVVDEEGSTGFSVSSNRCLLEFLIRSNGIWLHALKYSFTVSGGRSVSYQAPSPSWAHFEEK